MLYRHIAAIEFGKRIRLKMSRYDVIVNRLADSRATIAGVEVSRFSSLETAAAEWRALELQTSCSYYQSFGWCKAWAETVGQELGVKPFILIGKSKLGGPQFLLPFQIRKRYGLNILEWLCQPENNYGHGIFTQSSEALNWQDWFTENLPHVLAQLPPYDVAALCNLPETVFDRPSPLSAMHRFASANQSFVTHLESNFETLFQKKEHHAQSVKRADATNAWPSSGLCTLIF